MTLNGVMAVTLLFSPNSVAFGADNVKVVSCLCYHCFTVFELINNKKKNKNKNKNKIKNNNRNTTTTTSIEEQQQEEQDTTTTITTTPILSSTEM